jgi:hypothetical protein
VRAAASQNENPLLSLFSLSLLLFLQFQPISTQHSVNAKQKIYERTSDSVISHQAVVKGHIISHQTGAFARPFLMILAHPVGSWQTMNTIIQTSTEHFDSVQNS